MADNPMAGLPAHTPAPGDTFWRVYRTVDPDTGASRGPWYFASVTPTRPAAQAGRFDLPHPEGTCYLADDPAAAYREHFQALRVDPVDERQRALASIAPGRPVSFGDLASPDAEAFGISLVEATIRDRRQTQKIARQVRRAGFGGVRVLRRSDPSGTTHTVGLFDRAGPHRTLPSWRTKEGLPLVHPSFGATRRPRTMPLASPPGLPSTRR